ncbi:adenylyltransferase/cytidyltransferase family protein [Shewanella violacea]|uniref:Glycerol-3-phosphate cytidyltransferase, putative n=1 Tax=Shewanella violacea (strain JCM 10179 / CIP 106290 / LMG 19151 / DSS12) TaxID=637905 RepID=D4ZDF5_SHEVD|nr:adenylyltransferase/cytidyltransferase family protein [Shewanella violacea]BAJ00077.1 glycerol-3-phosphate cytidyltransferase, putative [Shewanella violacea DSS12]
MSKKVLVVGVFDLFHRGHVEFLQKAAEFGDELIILINGDEMTEKYKRRPIYNEDDRAAILNSLACVSQVEVTNSFDIKPIIEKYGIDIIAHGDDWEHESYLAQIRCTPAYLDEQGVSLAYTQYHKSVSTSAILKQIKES